jgi:hypothetical protein
MLGIGVPNEFPNLQSAIVGDKTHYLQNIFILLKKY